MKRQPIHDEEPSGPTEVLDPAACYLINVAARALTTAAARALTPLSISPSQIPVLLALEARGPLTQSDLARLTYVEQPTMAQLLRRMQRDGLVERSPDSVDRRRVMFSLRPKGRRLIPEMQHLRSLVDEKALKGLSDSQRDQLGGSLAHIVANLTED